MTSKRWHTDFAVMIVGKVSADFSQTQGKIQKRNANAILYHSDSRRPVCPGTWRHLDSREEGLGASRQTENYGFDFEKKNSKELNTFFN